MRNTKSHATKPLARSSPRDDNNPRARHDDLTTTEGDGDVSLDTNATSTARTADADMPMLTEAQQNFFNDAIAQTRRQTLLENANSREEERNIFQQQLEYMHEQMAQMKQEQQEQIATLLQENRDMHLQHVRTSSSVVANPTHAFETPKAQRPQDKAYQDILTANKANPIHIQDQTMNSTPTNTDAQQTTHGLMQLLSSVGNILKHSKKEDTTELPKFLGGDSQWPKWYQLLRAYLQARGWLTTFDHPIGPGTLQIPTPDFDTDINSLIYQKLQAKCFEGTASTYVRMAAEFDGHGAGAHLKKRYNNSSPQQLESYILLAKNHRHTSGTSMPLHIDQYEAILGYMPDCGKIPTNTERIDWFLPTVTEDIYASAKAMCLTQKIQGTLDWGSMVLLFNHTCFARYPHFQIAELQTGNSLKKHTQNNTNYRNDKCALHPEGNHTTAECKKLRQLQVNPSGGKGGRGRGMNKGKGTGRAKGKTMTPWVPTRDKGKSGKGKGKPSAMGSRTPKFTGTCSHCGIVGHMARDCYKRQQETTKTVKQNTVSFTDDPSTLQLTPKPDFIQFQQFPTFVKRKLEGSSTNNDSDEDTSDDVVNLDTATDKWETAITMQTDAARDPPQTTHSWGQRNNPNNDEENSDWGDTPAIPPTHNYSPERNPHRSGICQYCDTPIGSKRMNGPLTCHSCRLLLQEDEEHNKEQQQYEDRRQSNEDKRQAKYQAQLAGTTEESNSQQLREKDEDTRWGENNEDQSPLILPPEENSPPTTPRELPQNFTRITLTQIFRTKQCQRKDGLIKTRKLTITPHLNPFTCLQEVQDAPPPSRWTTHILNYHIAYLREQTRRQEKKSGNSKDKDTRSSPSIHITQIAQNSTQKNVSLSGLSRVPKLRLQPRVRHLGAVLHGATHLGVGTVPQSPSANATPSPVPDTSSMACLMNEELTPFMSANATSLMVPDTARLMKGGLAPLTSANAISLTIPDTLHKKHKKLPPVTIILRQNVTFVQPMEQTLGHVTPINPTLNDAITLNPGQRVIIDGRQWRLRERPTIIPTIPPNPEQTKTKDQQTQTSPINLYLNLSPVSPAESGQSSDGSVATYYKCYIPPDINESNAESVQREREIQRRVNKRKRDKLLPERSSHDPVQRSGLRDTWLSINIEPIPPHLTSLTVEEDKDIGNTPNNEAPWTSPTVPATPNVDGGSPRSDKAIEVDLTRPMNQEQDLNLQDCPNNNGKEMKQLVQTITLDDLNPHGLYPNPDQPLSPQDITVLYDSGASITMLPGAFKESWRNLRPSLMSLSGAYADAGIQNVCVGEFHAQMTLDTGETIRVVIPEAVSLPTEATTYLLCDTQFLLAGHKYVSDLRAPKLEFAQGGSYTMDIVTAHKIIKLLPISAHEETNHRTILLHQPTPYEPPTFYNNVTIRRPDITTPTARMCLQRGNDANAEKCDRNEGSKRFMENTRHTITL